ncbi:MAG: hypothetical protein ACYTGN_00965 [Planctomycetota bacterium]
MRSLLTVLLCSVCWAAPDEEPEDVMHPRAADTPLKVVFKPYYCELCVKEERIEQQDVVMSMMRMEVGALAKELDLDKGWIAIQSPNFKLLSSMRRSKVKFKGSRYARGDLQRLQQIFPKLKMGRDGASVNAHQRAHLYVIRAERLYTHFAALTDNKQRFLGMESHYELFLTDQYNPYHVLVDKFIGRGQKMPGVQDHQKDKPNFNVFASSEQQASQSKGKGDQAFNNWFIHNVAHLLVDGHGNYYRDTWAWLEEGVGHYYERLENTRYNTFCRSEGKSPGDFLKPNWKPVIYGIVRRGKDTPLSQWCEKLQPGELTGTENGLSWSIVKWLIETEPVRFTKLLRKLDDYQNKPSSAQGIEYAFGISPTVLHQRWREYVLKEYKTKK